MKITIKEVMDMYLKDVLKGGKNGAHSHREIGTVTIYMDSDEFYHHLQGNATRDTAYIVLGTRTGAKFFYNKEPENFLEMAERMRN